MTTLRSAHHGRPGRYYEAFFELSIGVERIGKLIFALDRRESMRAFPTDHEFRAITKSARSYHDLEKLFATLGEITDRRGLNVEPYPACTPTGAAVLAFLSDFASRDRYYNLTTLSDRTQENADDRRAGVDRCEVVGRGTRGSGRTSAPRGRAAGAVVDW